MRSLSRVLDVSAAVLVLTAISIGSVGMDRRSDLRTNLALRVLPGDDQSSAMRAVVVMQAEDCESLLGGLSALRGKSGVSSLSLAGVAVTGRSSDTTIVRTALRETADSLTPIHAIDARAQRQLRGLGYTSTPLLLVFDQQQLRYASPLARDDLELRQLRRALMAIASETAQRDVPARP